MSIGPGGRVSSPSARLRRRSGRAPCYKATSIRPGGPAGTSSGVTRCGTTSTRAKRPIAAPGCAAFKACRHV